MKKTKLFLAVLGFVVLGMTSCKKCYECTTGNGYYNVCKDSNQSQSEFDAKIKYLRTQGATCK